MLTKPPRTIWRVKMITVFQQLCVCCLLFVSLGFMGSGYLHSWRWRKLPLPKLSPWKLSPGKLAPPPPPVQDLEKNICGVRLGAREQSSAVP